VTIQLAIGH